MVKLFRQRQHPRQSSTSSAVSAGRPMATTTTRLRMVSILTTMALFVSCATSFPIFWSSSNTATTAKISVNYNNIHQRFLSSVALQQQKQHLQLDSNDSDNNNNEPTTITNPWIVVPSSIQETDIVSLSKTTNLVDNNDSVQQKVKNVFQISLFRPLSMLKHVRIPRLFQRQQQRQLSSQASHQTTTKTTRPVFPTSLSRKLVLRWKWTRLALSTVVMGGTATAAFWSCYPNVACASAPVMALPKAQQRDPITDAMLDHQRRMAVKAQAELREFAARARQIQAEQGEAARIQFERQYQQERDDRVQTKARELEQLKRNLLDQGIDPFCDLEGRRQVIFKKDGLDLAHVRGTDYHSEWLLQQKNSPKTYEKEHGVQRQIIQCMVQDLKNRNQDPLPYFENHQEQTSKLLAMPISKANVLLQQYQTNLERYGQVVPPKDGELSVLERRALEEEAAAKAAAKRNPKEARRLAKEAAAAERAAIKLQQQQERIKAKEMAIAAKEKAQLEQQQQAAKAVQEKYQQDLAILKANAPALEATLAKEKAAGVDTATSAMEVTTAESDAVATLGESTTSSSTAVQQSLTLPPSITSIMQSPIAKVSIGVVALAGGAYGLQNYREKAAREEEERQRQFRLLMGWDQENDTKKKSSTETSVLELDNDQDFESKSPTPSESKPEEVVDGDVGASIKEPVDPTTTTAESESSKKRKLGFVFKRKAERETNLNALVGADAKAPEFALVLAKTLTAGAPGRFPHVVELPGSVEASSDLEMAKQQLVDAREAAGLSLEESAEIFANVVNCMLIDIVDLASTSLKEKEEKATVDAIRIVVDFMNYAASLYDSVAGSVTITPVTYSGTLSKNKLEQMYSAYAAAGVLDMSQLDDNFENRVRLLQDVFQINEKKAEGLMMKAMQKNMMKMLKTGEGMEGMEAMMKSMGGGGADMASLLGGGDLNGSGGEAPSPEQLKEMLLTLKQLKDSGSIPPQELDVVKTQFREAFGSSIDDVMREADTNRDAMTESDKELLELMKTILTD